MWGIFLSQASNPWPLHFAGDFLTTGPPAKSEGIFDPTESSAVPESGGGAYLEKSRRAGSEAGNWSWYCGKAGSTGLHVPDNTCFHRKMRLGGWEAGSGRGGLCYLEWHSPTYSETDRRVADCTTKGGLLGLTIGGASADQGGGWPQREAGERRNDGRASLWTRSNFIHSFNAIIFSPRNIPCALIIHQALELQWKTRCQQQGTWRNLKNLRLSRSSHPQNINSIDSMNPFIWSSGIGR